jgi:hypothetical protein
MEPAGAGVAAGATLAALAIAAFLPARTAGGVERGMLVIGLVDAKRGPRLPTRRTF